jgi:hypothetical protein
MSGFRAHVLNVNTKRISRVFASTFARWKLRIPEENLAREKAGFIQKEGWLVQYGFGHDETGGYLDYYAARRMTSDDHINMALVAELVDPSSESTIRSEEKE